MGDEEIVYFIVRGTLISHVNEGIWLVECHMTSKCWQWMKRLIGYWWMTSQATVVVAYSNHIHFARKSFIKNFALNIVIICSL